MISRRAVFPGRSRDFRQVGFQIKGTPQDEVVTVETGAASRESKGRREFTVLIVDDEPDARRLLREVVRRLPRPCRVLDTPDGGTALEIARQSRPDLVLLDIVLPGSSTSGVLVCQELCKDPRTKVVIVSGKASESITQACLSLGAVEIIRKPFSVAEVTGTLERLLEQ